MASVVTQRAEAVAEVELLAQTTSDPVLDTSLEVEPLVNRYQRADQWRAGASYNFGERVVPTTLNGRVYRCTQAGISGVTEPVWPVDGLTAWNSVGSWLSVTDNTAEWEDAGALENVFDVRAAATAAVLSKMGKLAARPDFSADGVTVKRASTLDSLKELLRSLRPAGIA